MGREGILCMQRLDFALAAVFGALLIASASGCAASTIAPVDRDLTGTWIRVPTIAGSSEVWNLVAVGSTFTGTGQWTGEACCSGTVVVAGTVRGDSLHADVTYQTTFPTARADVFRQFDGHIDAVGGIVLRIVLDGSIITTRFEKRRDP